jgi:hypothetical protein
VPENHLRAGFVPKEVPAIEVLLPLGLVHALFQIRIDIFKTPQADIKKEHMTAWHNLIVTFVYQLLRTMRTSKGSYRFYFDELWLVHARSPDLNLTIVEACTGTG